MNIEIEKQYKLMLKTRRIWCVDWGKGFSTSRWLCAALLRAWWRNRLASDKKRNATTETGNPPEPSGSIVTCAADGRA
jgi:hypothetical protein